MKKYVAAMDIGTSGTKSIIIDENAAVLAAATEEYPLYSPKPSWNEQDPEDWWKGACDSMKKAIKASGIAAEDIGVLSLSGQMHGLVPMDKDNNIIRRAFLWNDSRCDKQCGEVIDKLGGIGGLLRHTNNNLLPGYQGGKIIWLREEEPDNYAKMTRAVLPKDYIRYMLTGEFATEVSDASGTGFFDVKNRTWAEELLKILDLPLSLFPKVVESDVITGEISAAAAELTGLAKGTPVVGGGGDAVIQTTGMGLIEDGVVGLILGTAGIVAMGMSKYQDNTGGRLQFFCNNASELYHVMGVSLAAGGSYQWYRNNLCKEEIKLAKEQGIDPYELMNKDAEAVPPGSRGVLWLPYLSGERCPYSDPTLRAAFLGLSQGFSKAEMTRAVMEGVTFSLRQIVEAMKDLAPVSMSHVIVSGGGSNSPLWRQIVSDTFQLPVKTIAGGGEGGAFGAALVGGVGIGVWKNLAEACANISMTTANEPNAANKAAYDEMYGIYDGMYDLLKPMHDRMAKL